jgi:hypothetical protein
MSEGRKIARFSSLASGMLCNPFSMSPFHFPWEEALGQRHRRLPKGETTIDPIIVPMSADVACCVELLVQYVKPPKKTPLPSRADALYPP